MRFWIEYFCLNRPGFHKWYLDLLNRCQKRTCKLVKTPQPSDQHLHCGLLSRCQVQKGELNKLSLPLSNVLNIKKWLFQCVIIISVYRADLLVQQNLKIFVVKHGSSFTLMFFKKVWYSLPVSSTVCNQESDFLLVDSWTTTFIAL